MHKAEQKTQTLSFWARVLRFVSEFTAKQIGIVLVVGVLCAALGYTATMTFAKPLYSSTVTIAVMNERGSKVSHIQNLSVCYQLAKTLAAAGRNQEAAAKTIERMELSMEPRELLSKIRVSRREKTMLVRVRAMDTDPELAQQIAEVYTEEMLEVLGETLFIYNAPRLHGPSLAKSIGGLRQNSFVCGLLGCFAALWVFYRRHRRDRTIKVAKDLAPFEKPVIGEITVIRGASRQGGAA
ncbi:MAG: hypothetical protein IJC88_06580 [Oscillospiraceae bacterium]|nr:hypothetical protein [Oscillospiraceae bacterium]